MNAFARLNKPWLHFIVLGVVCYQLQSALFPEPMPVIGPLSEARVETLKNQWRTSTGRVPTDQQLAKFVAAELDRDMLLQHAIELEFHLRDSIVHQRLVRIMKFLQLGEERSDSELFEQAIEMRLHLDDEVVKRRLIQMMEQRLLAKYPPSKPTTIELQAEFENRKAELQHPPQYSFEHVFFNETQVSDAPSIIAKISKEQLDIEAARVLGSPFLQGNRFLRQTPDQLTRNFGRHFVQALQEQQPAPGWLGPIASAYGLHYLWLSEFEPARDAELHEVKQQLLADLDYVAQKQGLQCAIEKLRSEYLILSEYEVPSKYIELSKYIEQGGALFEEACI